MATFASLISEIYTLTKRPDLIAETKLALKQATLRAHHSDFYPRDMHEVGFSWNTPAFTQSLEYQTVFPDFRALKYIRKYADGAPGAVFTVLTPLEILDRYGIERENVCYLAGRMIEIKSSTEDTDMIIGYYKHPDLTEANYTSWIADQYEHVVVTEAAAIIFKMIGFDEQAALFNQLTAQNIISLRASALQLEGY